MTGFNWVDYSNNKETFTINDSRIKTVTCELVDDESNNYALVKNKEISVNRELNQLEFNINRGAITGTCILTIKIHITDIWGIKSVIEETIKVANSEASAKKH